MTHLTDEDLILRFYGEPMEKTGVDAHLATCAPCHARFMRLQRVLSVMEAMQVPERDAAYGAQVWRQVEPRLARRSPWSLIERMVSWRDWIVASFQPVRWPALTGAVALLLIGFLGGRYWTANPPVEHVADSQPAMGTPLRSPAFRETEPFRERILLSAIAEHLEQSNLILLELLNSSQQQSLNVETEQGWATDLAAANRLYRLTASQAGELGLSSFLEDLEGILIEIALGPTELSAADLKRLRDQLERQEVLFKLRVLGADLRAREKSMNNRLVRTSSST